MLEFAGMVERMESGQNRFTLGVLLILLLSAIPLNAPSASAEIVCCNSSEFELHLVGNNADATMTPFLSELNGINEKTVTQSVQGVEEIETWTLNWEHSDTIPESTWDFSIDYEVQDAIGVHANATVEVKIGDKSYSGESGNPGTYLSQDGTVSVSVEIPERFIRSGDTIAITFAVRSLLFTQPGDDTAIRFVWGEDTDSAISVNLPLLDIEMPNALIVGDEVFFPIILKSGFGDRMWTSLEKAEFKVNGALIADVRSPSLVSGGVEIPFVWSPSPGSPDGVRTVNFSIWLNEGDMPIQSERNHDINFAEGGGGDSYEFGEPLRTAGSTLDVDIDVEYDSDKVRRTVEFGIEGAMAQWLRWGMDNIGNTSLRSDHFFDEGKNWPDIDPSKHQNGRVDTEEVEALQGWIDSSTWNLKDFIDSGLALDPESLFEGNLFDMSPEITIDLHDVVGISDKLLTIRIDILLELSGQERLLLITDFARPQLNTPIWSGIDLSVTLTTSAFSGLYEVESDGIEVTHYRVGIMDVVTIDVEGLNDQDNFDVKYTVVGNALFSPFVTLLASVLLLLAAIVAGWRMTRYRSRIFIFASTPVFIGIVGYAYILSALPPTFVMGIAGACLVLMVPIAIVSPKRYDEQFLSDGSLDDDFESAMDREIPTVNCPACGTGNPVESQERPLRLPCGGCGRTLRIEA
ncbi:MAG: hypothetical protein QF440_05455 [Candidatus Thalassarchaeaceae archaeon]|nr:hypothetical protein [Candidatus Thalassarchaeaceae archaeon]